MRKLISILLCLAMVFGSAASAFADTSKGSATTLRLEKTEGKVAITKSGGKSVSVKDGTRLYDGYELKTDTKSAAYISLDSAKAIMMDASTDVTVKKSGKKLEVMLKSGTILLNVEDKLAGNEELNIRTTNSVTGIRGTIAQFTFNPETQNTEIYLFEGMTTGKYLAPDGSWYTQTLTTGSWLASGMGMLADHPEYNGWTLGPMGEWIYTNNKIEGTQFRQWRWSAEQGWFTFDTITGSVTKQDAWPFTFKDLQPKSQLEILNDTGMLTRGQEHLDLYPELADNKLSGTASSSAEALALQQKNVQKQTDAIEDAFVEGNGGNTVDNLFETRTPSVPTYAMVYLMDDPASDPAAATFTTQYYREGEAVSAPADPAREGYTFAGWSAALPAAKAPAAETVYATWTVNQYTLTFLNNDGTVLTALTQDYGTAVTAPVAPDATGCTFTGWSPAAPATMPAADMTLTPVQTPNPYTITFKDDDGTILAAITDSYGAAISAPATPTKTGYTFTSWDAAIPATMPAGDMTITAAWSLNNYTVAINSSAVTAFVSTVYDKANPAAALTPDTDTGTTQEYIVPFGTVLELAITSTPTLDYYRVTSTDAGGETKYYTSVNALSGISTYTIPVDSGENITLNVNELAAADTTTVFAYVDDGSNGETADITYSGKIINVEISDANHTFYIDGNEGLTITAAGKYYSGEQYGITGAETIPGTSGAAAPVTPVSYDGFTGTYLITSDTRITTEVVNAVSFTGATDKFTVDNSVFTYGGVQYVFGYRITITTDTSKVTITDPLNPQNNIVINQTVGGATTPADGLEAYQDTTDPTVFHFEFDATDGASYDVSFI